MLPSFSALATSSLPGMSAPRVVVCRAPDSCGRASPAHQFGTCLLDSLGLPSTHQTAVDVKSQPDGTVVLLQAGSVDEGGAITHADPDSLLLGNSIPLAHSPNCPCRGAARRHEPPKADSDIVESVRLAVVALIEDADGSVLLTRRHPKLRSFPSAWVMPGGHVDPGETAIDAAAREVHEETGLEVDSLELLCMWESCFPTRVDLGALRRHTLMLVYRARVKGHAGLRLQADEVDMAAWVPAKQLLALLDDNSTEHDVPEELPPLECTDGGVVPWSSLGGVYPNTSGQGIAQGHLFALRARLGLVACQ